MKFKSQHKSLCIQYLHMRGKTQESALTKDMFPKHLHVRGGKTTESGLFTLYMRRIESFRAILSKNKTTYLLLFYQTFALFPGQQSKPR